MKTIKAFLVCIFTSTLFLNAQDVASAKGAIPVDQADALLEECINFKELVGMSAGILKDNEIVWSKGAGFIDLENKVPATNQMVHRTASISKPMTAFAILQLFEQKKLDLEDPIQKYLPDFPVKKEGTIKIKHLMNHSSGIKAYKTGSEAYSLVNYPTLSSAIDVFKNRSLNHKPGTDYKYTTYGYVVLGAIIEKASGMSYRDYMKKNIWDVAGMDNTDVEVFGKKYPNKSKLYVKNEEGQFELDKFTDLSIKVPGGGIQSTVEDLLKFGQAVLENKFVSANTLEMMVSDTGVKKRGNPYGLGWYIYGKKEDESGRVVGHSGAQSGTSTQLLIYLDKKIVTVALMNTADAWGRAINVASRLGYLARNTNSNSIYAGRAMLKKINEEGLENVLTWFEEIKEEEETKIYEEEMNALGYHFMNEGKMKEAIAIFDLNAKQFPESWNAFDSLGEAYLKNGNKDLAVANYKKSIKLNPDNKEGIKILKKIK